jgi:hypothetical protein
VTALISFFFFLIVYSLFILSLLRYFLSLHFFCRHLHICFPGSFPFHIFSSPSTCFVFLVEITNKMQPCFRIYYSTVHWRLNMFRAAYHSSSWALTLFGASGLHTHVVTGRSQVWVGNVPTQTWLRPVTTCICKLEAANNVGAPDDERCLARNMFSLQWTVE